jgi:predicted NUDIX family NTP pyrophosphohydrolase
VDDSQGRDSGRRRTAAAALREFEEETGLPIDESSKFHDLGSIRQKGGKTVPCLGGWRATAPAGHVLKSNTFRIEWPPRSGKFQDFPEIDRAEFFPVDLARQKINPAQIAFIDRLLGGPDRLASLFTLWSRNRSRTHQPTPG